MNDRDRSLLRAFAGLVADLPRGETLGFLAGELNLSRYHAHRVFRRFCGETPNEVVARVSLSRAAAALLASDASVLEVALDAGYESHEAFTRAFTSRYGVSPSRYRSTARSAATTLHTTAVETTGPCVRLYRSVSGRGSSTRREEPMGITIATREQHEQPTLVIRRRIAHDEISGALGEALPKVYEYAMQRGVEFAGMPFCAYREWTPGSVLVEAGMPVATPTEGEGEIVAATIPGGTYAVALHEGEYDTLDATHVALDQWIEAEGHHAESVRYEIYLTDPGQYPDPKDWRTEVIARLEDA